MSFNREEQGPLREALRRFYVPESMKVGGAISLLCYALLFVSCGRAPHDPLAYLRIAELEDSLKAYRDSLKDAQLAFSFNAVTAVVRLQEDEIKLGDSCRAEIFIGAANTPDAVAEGYAYGDAKLEISGLPDHRITNTGTHWVVAFKPDHLGEDSLLGTIELSGKRGPVTRLDFGHLYEVVPR